MSDLTDPNEPTVTDEMHDLLLANYLQNRVIIDLLYCLVTKDVATPQLAEALKSKHAQGEFFYPDVIPEQE